MSSTSYAYGSWSQRKRVPGLITMLAVPQTRIQELTAKYFCALESNHVLFLHIPTESRLEPGSFRTSQGIHPNHTVIQHLVAFFGAGFEPDTSIVHSTSWRYRLPNRTADPHLICGATLPCVDAPVGSSGVYLHQTYRSYREGPG